MDKHIRLIDSPGVVFSSVHEDNDGSDQAVGGNMLRNCVNVDEITNYLPVIEALLHRCTGPYLMQLYNIPRFPDLDATAFLSNVARAQGKLKKGGVPLIDAAARTVLHDWNTGKIRYHTLPPALPAGATTNDDAEKAKTDTQLLSTMSEGINWDTWQKPAATAAAAEMEESEEVVEEAPVAASAKKGKKKTAGKKKAAAMETD